jgi:hypothetical protein
MSQVSVNEVSCVRLESLGPLALKGRPTVPFIDQGKDLGPPAVAQAASPLELGLGTGTSGGADASVSERADAGTSGSAAERTSGCRHDSAADERTSGRRHDNATEQTRASSEQTRCELSADTRELRAPSSEWLSGR